MGCPHGYSASAALCSDTLRKSQTAGSAVDAAASEGTALTNLKSLLPVFHQHRFRKVKHCRIWQVHKTTTTRQTALFVATVVATAHFRIQIQLLDCHNRVIVNSITCKFNYLQIPPPLLPKSITCNFSAPKKAH